MPGASPERLSPYYGIVLPGIVQGAGRVAVILPWTLQLPRGWLLLGLRGTGSEKTHELFGPLCSAPGRESSGGGPVDHSNDFGFTQIAVRTHSWVSSQE